MNNWKAIGYIFLGFGSVFLSYALIAFFAITSCSTSFLNLAPVALAAQTPWFVLAALAYVVGVVGYFAGKENTPMSPSTNIANVDEKAEPASRHVSIRLDTMWSFPIGTFIVLIVFALQIALGFWNPTDVIFGVIFPILYSIVAGSIVGLVALLLIDKMNES